MSTESSGEPQWALLSNPALDSELWSSPEGVYSVSLAPPDIPPTSVPIKGIYALTARSLAFSEMYASTTIGIAPSEVGQSLDDAQQALGTVDPWEATAKAIVLGLITGNKRPRGRADFSTAQMYSFTARALGKGKSALAANVLPEQMVRTLFEVGRFVAGAIPELSKVCVKTSSGDVPARFLPLQTEKAISKPQELRRLGLFVIREANLIPNGQSFGLSKVEQEFMSYRANGFNMQQTGHEMQRARAGVTLIGNRVLRKLGVPDIMSGLRLMSGVETDDWDPSPFLRLTTEENIVLRTWANGGSNVHSIKVLRHMGRKVYEPEIAKISQNVLQKLYAKDRIQAVWTALTTPSYS